MIAFCDQWRKRSDSMLAIIDRLSKLPDNCCKTLNLLVARRFEVLECTHGFYHVHRLIIA